MRDAARVSLVSTGTIGPWDRRRFRVNVNLEGEGEDAFVGSRMALGDAVLDVDTRIERCVMTTRPQAGGVERDLDVLRTINRGNETVAWRWARSLYNPGSCESAIRSHPCRRPSFRRSADRISREPNTDPAPWRSVRRTRRAAVLNTWPLSFAPQPFARLHPAWHRPRDLVRTHALEMAARTGTCSSTSIAECSRTTAWSRRGNGRRSSKNTCPSPCLMTARTWSTCSATWRASSAPWGELDCNPSATGSARVAFDERVRATSRRRSIRADTSPVCTARLPGVDR